MAKHDVEALLVPVSEDAPSGPNLEYDLAFTALEQAAAPKAEKSMGASVIAGEEPDWQDVIDRSETLLSRSKDLRVAIHLATAWLKRDGLPGGAAGLALVHGIVERFWPDFHPQLDAEDDDDPTFRVNSAAPLASPNDWLKHLRVTPFVASNRLGRFSLRDLRIANGTLKVAPKAARDDEDAAPEAQPTMTLIEGCCKDAPESLLFANADAISAALESAKAIDRLFTNQLGASGPDLKNLLTDLADLKKFVDPQAAARRPVAAARVQTAAIDDGDADSDDDEYVPSNASARSGSAVVMGRSGPISGPDDVIRRIDELCDYYAVAEPSSPVPLLLRRAQRLVGRSFIELLQDLAPGGIAQLQVLSGPVTGVTGGAATASSVAAPAAHYDDDD